MAELARRVVCAPSPYGYTATVVVVDRERFNVGTIVMNVVIRLDHGFRKERDS